MGDGFERLCIYMGKNKELHRRLKTLAEGLSSPDLHTQVSVSGIMIMLAQIFLPFLEKHLKKGNTVKFTIKVEGEKNAEEYEITA